MKNKVVLFLFLMLFASKFYSQVAIGKETVDGLGILDFASNDKRGIILPYTNSVLNPTNGTLTFDTNSKKIKSFVNNNWIDMTFEGNLPVLNTNPDLTTQNGVIIGASTSTATGVLVLESNNKALILPKVNNVTEIFNPSSGTICYDLSVNALAIYNGVEWSYWK
jgi:hypothetical protein